MLVAQSCPTLCNTMGYSLSGSYVHGILQARILEWVAISFSRGSSQLRDGNYVSCIGRQILYHWAIWQNTYNNSSNRNLYFKRIFLFQCYTFISGNDIWLNVEAQGPTRQGQEQLLKLAVGMSVWAGPWLCPQGPQTPGSSRLPWNTAAPGGRQLLQNAGTRE